VEGLAVAGPRLRGRRCPGHRDRRSG
jgi:hypothetical protein